MYVDPSAVLTVAAGIVAAFAVLSLAFAALWIVGRIIGYALNPEPPLYVPPSAGTAGTDPEWWTEERLEEVRKRYHAQA